MTDASTVKMEKTSVRENVTWENKRVCVYSALKIVQSHSHYCYHKHMYKNITLIINKDLSKKEYSARNIERLKLYYLTHISVKFNEYFWS